MAIMGIILITIGVIGLALVFPWLWLVYAFLVGWVALAAWGASHDLSNHGR